ncbi:MAG: hypothetical protein QOJ35_2337 [Solirubrobacteraceae bacterium]|jgi:hypothetical protein|nr:hypothetical protein [Solirubrobacteraceae bacterium]
MTSIAPTPPGRGGTAPPPAPARLRARDAALRRTRVAIAAIAAGAVGLCGAFSVVAAQAFKGHPARTATPARRAPAVSVPGPQAIPSIANDPAPLQPPSQPPAAETQPAPPQAPPQQASGGS